MDRIARAMLALFEAPPAGAAVAFALYDDQLRYVAVSDSLAAVHEHPAADSVGRTVRDVQPELADELEPVLRDVLETGEPRLGVEVGGRGGRTWLGSYYPLHDGGTAVIVAIAVEITDRKRAEQALRESRERLVEAQRLARMGAWTWHVQERRAEWAGELFSVFGMSGPEAPTLETWQELLIPEDRDELLSRLLLSIRTGASFDLHFRFRRPDGIVTHIRAAGDAIRGTGGRVVALRGFAQDVTEARRAEAQQRAVAELGQLALGGADLDALFDRAVADVAAALEVEQTALMEELPDTYLLLRAGRGWPDDAVRGEPVPPTGQAAYTLNRDVPVLVEDWDTETRFEPPAVLQAIGARSGATVPIVCADGRFGVLGAQSVHRRRFSREDLTFMQSVANVLAGAINARRAADRINELADARQRLVAQSLDAEERTRRVIAEALHDGALQEALVLRHTLGRLLGGGLGGQEEAERARGAIERMADQLREAMVALHPTVLEAGGLASALQAVADQQARIGGFTADVDVDPEAVGVRDQLILSIARELLVNAAKHARARRVRVQVRRAGDGVELEVSDDGAGIPEERLRAALAEGHIGLASSAERLAAVGGRLVIGGGPGQGTVATARLPA